MLQLGGWTNRARNRLEMVPMDRLGRPSVDRGRIDGPGDCLRNCPRSYSSGTLFPGCLQAANETSGPATPPQGPPPGLRRRGQQLGREKRLAAFLSLAASSPLSPTPLCSPPAASPTRLSASSFANEYNTYFPRTIRRLAGGWSEIIHIKSAACGWHIVGIQETNHRGSRYNPSSSSYREGS